MTDNKAQYYDEILKKMDKTQVFSAIRGIKQEIGKLKRIMETPGYNSAEAAIPSESTQILWNRIYLERAKKALGNFNETYTPSKAELKAKSFDNSIDNISKITFSIGGFYDGYKTAVVDINGSEIRYELKYKFEGNTKTIIPECDFPCSKDELLNSIRELHLGEWKVRYEKEKFGYSVRNGVQWHLLIEFSNGSKPFRVYGSGLFPYNFNELKALMIINHTENDK